MMKEADSRSGPQQSQIDTRASNTRHHALQCIIELDSEENAVTSLTRLREKFTWSHIMSFIDVVHMGIEVCRTPYVRVV